MVRLGVRASSRRIDKRESEIEFPGEGFESGWCLLVLYERARRVRVGYTGALNLFLGPVFGARTT